MNNGDITWQERERDAAATPETGMINRLPELLRILGTAALLIAMYSFLVKGWHSGNDVFRYLLMLAHTGILAAVGLASGHWLKESKGARLLLTLALVSVPANFAILGAFIFSQTAAIDISQYPHYVAWAVESINTALITTGGALFLLIPITLLGFTVLARSMSRRLSLLFLLNNAVLLLPLRDPMLISLVVLSLTLVSVLMSHNTAHQQMAARTREGITALGLQFLPLAVLMGRSLWLYSMDMFLFSVLLVSLFYLMRQASMYLQTDSKLRQTIEAISLVPAIVIVPIFALALFDSTVMINSLAIPIASLTSAIMVYDISRRSISHAVGYRHITAALLLVCLLANLVLFTGLLSALVCLGVGLGLLLLGFRNQQRGIFSSGIILMLSGLAHQLYELMHHFDLSSWASLAVLGVIAIVVASAIESEGGKFRPRISEWKNAFKQWEQ